MNKNDYRRAFIMLRAAIQGYGGHVRLERRTLTGSMYFIVTAPQDSGPLAAALAGQRNGEYYAAPIGRLTRDRRGQLTLAWQFDPRDIAGRPLEAYAWVAVARTDAPCAIALNGNVEGSRTLDPVALSRAVCALYAPAEEPAADLPDRGEPEDTQSDIKIYTGSRSRLFARRAGNEAAHPDDGPAPEIPPEPIAPVQAPAEPPAVPANAEVYIDPPAEPVPKPPADPLPAPEELLAETAPVEEAPAVEAPAQDAPVETFDTSACVRFPTAAKLLGLDITEPWPGEAEGLRRLFATQPPAKDPPDDGYTYVLAPMPGGSGYAGYLAGLRVEGGRIAAARYALPARYAPEPPAGLERYRWSGGGGEGYWVLDVDMPDLN